MGSTATKASSAWPLKVAQMAQVVQVAA